MKKKPVDKTGHDPFAEILASYTETFLFLSGAKFFEVWRDFFQSGPKR